MIYDDKYYIKKIRRLIKELKLLKKFEKISYKCINETSNSDPPLLRKHYRTKIVDKKYKKVWITPNSFTKFHTEGNSFFTEWFLYHDHKGQRFEISKTLIPSITLNDSSKNKFSFECTRIF